MVASHLMYESQPSHRVPLAGPTKELDSCMHVTVMVSVDPIYGPQTHVLDAWLDQQRSSTGGTVRTSKRIRIKHALSRTKVAALTPGTSPSLLP